MWSLWPAPRTCIIFVHFGFRVNVNLVAHARSAFPSFCIVRFSPLIVCFLFLLFYHCVTCFVNFFYEIHSALEQCFVEQWYHQWFDRDVVFTSTPVTTSSPSRQHCLIPPWWFSGLYRKVQPWDFFFLYPKVRQGGKTTYRSCKTIKRQGLPTRP